MLETEQCRELNAPEQWRWNGIPHAIHAPYDLHSTCSCAHNQLIFINPKPHHTAASALSFHSVQVLAFFRSSIHTQRCFSSCDYCCSASTICSSCLIYEQQYDMPLYYPIKNNRNNTKRANIFALTLCTNGFWAYSLISIFFACFSISIRPPISHSLSVQHLSRAHFLLFALATCTLYMHNTHKHFHSISVKWYMYISALH